MTTNTMDRPPWFSTVVLAIQHALLALGFMVYPVTVATLGGFSAEATDSFLTGSLLACAVGTFLQSFRPPIGAGALAVLIPTPIFLPAMIAAGAVSNPSTLAGLVLLAGISELVFSRVLKHIRFLFPVEICGLAVLMLGLSLAKPALHYFAGVGPHEATAALDLKSVLISGGTLLGIIGVVVYGRGLIKIYSLGVGLVIGIGISWMLGVWGDGQFRQILATPLIGLPRLGLVVPTFQWDFIPLFIVMAISLSIDDLGMLVGIQRLADPDWKRIDVRQASAGIGASGLADVFGAILGGAMPTGISSTHTGLAYATGVSSRILSALVGVLLLMAAFTPSLVKAITLIPRPVIGGIMIYAAAYMLTSGMGLVLTRLLSERRVFTVGLAVIAGLTPEFLPGIFHQLPLWLQPVFQSNLAIAMIVGVGLNQVLRIGIARKAVFDPASPRPEMNDFSRFLMRQGQLWSGRREVFERATGVGLEVMEILGVLGVPADDVTITASFDEDNQSVSFQYPGPRLEFPAERTPAEQILAGSGPAPSWGCYLIGKRSDEITQSSNSGRELLVLRFEN